jgi:hypothetical protein
MFGTAVHKLLEDKYAHPQLSEKRISHAVNGYTITGKPDCFTHDGVLRDYKVTSVWTFIFGQKNGKKEWEEQLNVYAWLLRKNNYHVEEILITAILRDWNKRESLNNADYPQIAVQDVKIPLWTEEKQEEFILAKLANLVDNRDREDDEVQECTAEERWASPDKWAVMKNGGKRATRVFDNEEEAVELAAVTKEGYVQHRIGEDKRCSSYCNVNRWCHYYNKKKQEER